MAKSVYIVAALSAIAILFIVLFSLNLEDSSRIAQLNEEIKQISLESQLQNVYADFDENNAEVYCLVVNQGINSLSRRSAELDKTLRNYKEASFNTNEFISVKRSFLITNMILLKNLENAKKYCGLKTKQVIFFYAEDRSCEVECGVIGSQLEKLSQDCNSFKNFNFPYAWDYYEFTKILEVKFGVKKAGTLIIDGQKFDSLLQFDELKDKLGCE
jgi:hypothetical protein